LKDALELIKLCDGGVIDKVRHLVNFNGHLFEVDEFSGENQGLVVAEVELASEDEDFEKPDWLGPEVTGDRRYYNSRLLANPYVTWNQD
jgi:CYTH domain-containing protein